MIILSEYDGDSDKAATALHERLFRATITMQGETRVPIAIGRGRQSKMPLNLVDDFMLRILLTINN